jgi:DNA-binding NtrC family response regulator
LALIEGEAGTGKYLLAKHIQACHGAPGIMVAEEASTLFCAEVSPHSELLRGALRRSAGGTLLVRNIDELAAEPQGRLLHYIRTFETAHYAEKSGVFPCPSQVICTSRKPLSTLVLAAAFSPEIYYRLNAVSFTVPPLRDRKRRHSVAGPDVRR